MPIKYVRKGDANSPAFEAVQLRPDNFFYVSKWCGWVDRAVSSDGDVSLQSTDASDAAFIGDVIMRDPYTAEFKAILYERFRTEFEPMF